MDTEQKTYHRSAVDELQAAMAMGGDAHAFALLYQRWHPRLLRYALRVTGDAEEAREVMQESAIAIAQNIHRLKSAQKFGPWAFTIVRNRAASHIQKLQKDRELKRAVRDHMPETHYPVSTSEKAETLRNLIRTLSIKDREVLSAFYVDGMSIREISACFCVPEGTIKSRLYNARHHLKTVYETMKGPQDD